MAAALQRLTQAAAALPAQVPTTFMEVCGTHTVSACRSGLHSLLPGNIKLLSGPGCPVCVTSQGDIDLMIELAQVSGVTLCTYGDMLRVPGSRGNLEEARSRGAKVRIIYSTLDAVRLAAQTSAGQVVLAAVGFETTTPATAAAVRQAQSLGLNNFSVLTSHKLIIPAMRALLQSGQAKVRGFLCPGHVSIILGSDAYQPIVDDFGQSCVVAGFEPLQMAQGLACLAELAASGRAALMNQYPQVVKPQGNTVAQALVEHFFEPADVVWRGLGPLAGSGLALRPAFAAFDARQRFDLVAQDSPEPPGCRCGQVITGNLTPAQCELFGRACTPLQPIGPCMVSSEGTCHAWFKYRPGAVA